MINSLIKNISNDPKHKGKKTIKITQHKYGAKKTKAKPTPIAQRQQLQPTPQRTLEPTRTITQTKTQYRNLQQSQQVVQRQELRAAVPPAQPPQQILASEPEVGAIFYFWETGWWSFKKVENYFFLLDFPFILVYIEDDIENISH